MRVGGRTLSFLLGLASPSSADEPIALTTRRYSPTLATTGIVTGATGLASVVAGGIWGIAVLAGPRQPPPPCAPGQFWCADLFGDGTRPAWDGTPALALMGIGAGTMLIGAALVVVGLAPVRATRVGANGIAIAF